MGVPVFATSTVAVMAGAWDRAAVGGKQKLRRSILLKRRVRVRGTAVKMRRINLTTNIERTCDAKQAK
jgi:hypothetical protein